MMWFRVLPVKKSLEKQPDLTKNIDLYVLFLVKSFDILCYVD